MTGTQALYTGGREWLAKRDELAAKVARYEDAMRRAIGQIERDNPELAREMLEEMLPDAAPTAAEEATP